MEVFPGDQLTDDQIQGLINELKQSTGDDGVPLLLEYEIRGMAYWEVTGWRHQYIEKPTFSHPDQSGVVPNSWNRRGIVPTHSGRNERKRTERTEEKEPYVDDDDERTETKRKQKNPPTGGSAHEPSGGLENELSGTSEHDPGGGPVHDDNDEPGHRPVHEPAGAEPDATNHRRVDWNDVCIEYCRPARDALLPDGESLSKPMREVLFRAGWLAAERYGKTWLLDACRVTRNEKPNKPPNFLKGVLAKTSGLDRDAFFVIYDAIRVPQQYLVPPQR